MVRWAAGWKVARFDSTCLKIEEANKMNPHASSTFGNNATQFHFCEHLVWKVRLDNILQNVNWRPRRCRCLYRAIGSLQKRFWAFIYPFHNPFSELIRRFSACSGNLRFLFAFFALPIAFLGRLTLFRFGMPSPVIRIAFSVNPWGRFFCSVHFVFLYVLVV